MTHRLQCPSWLDGAARAEWRRIVEVEAPGELERDVLAAYCLVHSSWFRAVRRHRRRTAERAAEAAALRHLETARNELARALGIAVEADPEGRPTRILFVDEGPPD